jgi:hypothetical protein
MVKIFYLTWEMPIDTAYIPLVVQLIKASPALTKPGFFIYGRACTHSILMLAIVIGNTDPVTLGLRFTALIEVFLNLSISLGFISMMTSEVLWQASSPGAWVKPLYTLPGTSTPFSQNPKLQLGTGEGTGGTMRPCNCHAT